jgi:hypothetical protein
VYRRWVVVLSSKSLSMGKNGSSLASMLGKFSANPTSWPRFVYPYQSKVGEIPTRPPPSPCRLLHPCGITERGTGLIKGGGGGLLIL